MFLKNILVLLFAVAVRSESEKMIVLTASNFEHETQVTSGATTGDWFVKFYAPWCGHCKALAPIWEEVSEELKEGGLVNVAEVDVTQNGALGKRFDIQGFPTLLFFSKGKMYEYKAGEQWPRDKEHLVKFAQGGYKAFEWDIIPKPVSKLDELKKVATELVIALGYYASHMNEIGDNEWGFLALGMSSGTLMALFTYFIIGALFAPAVSETTTVPDEKKRK